MDRRFIFEPRIQNLLQTDQRGLNEADVDLLRAVYAGGWKFYRYIFNAQF